MATTQEQQTALQIIRTSNSIATPEQLAAVLADESVPRYCNIVQGERIGWLGSQLAALNYMAHSSRMPTEMDLFVESSMLDQVIMDDNSLRWLTQVEMQEAFRRGVAKEYGEFYGITASSISGWLRSFIKGEKRQQAKALLRMKEERENREANERLWSEIQEAKKRGLFVPTWGKDHDFKADEERRQRELAEKRRKQ